MWKPTFNHDDVEIIERKMTFDGFFKVEKLKYRFRLYRGGFSPILEREVMLKKHAAAVLLYHLQSDHVILVEQFRQGALVVDEGSPWVLEPVAGTLDKSNDPIYVAKEEAKEEAGCNVLELLPITTYLVSCGITNEKTTVYCGRIDDYQANAIHGLQEEMEDIKVCAIPSQQAFDMVANGQIYTASGVISLLWLQNNLAKVKHLWGKALA